MKTSATVASLIGLLTLSPAARDCLYAGTTPAFNEPPPGPTPFVAITPPPRVASSPSATPSTDQSAESSATQNTSPSPLSDKWDPFAEMQRMQADMDRFLRRSVQEFGTNPDFLGRNSEPGFSSSIDVRDKGDHYEVHAFLPNRDISKVNVTAEANNLLRIKASGSKVEKKTDKLTQTFAAEFGQYEQLVTLPGPANTKEMKVDRKEHEITVTLPKAKS